MISLAQLRFDDAFQRSLPADPDTSNQRRQVHGACFSRVEPTPVAAPYLIAFSPDAARRIDLPASECESARFVEVFSGNRLLPAMQPYSACYGGHQFGNWAGQLGDGRAITLGEVIATSGQRWELQLKGAGPTPYSRTADGRAVVRSSVREFLCSEAMHFLGVPTTRALCLIGTGESVVRDMFYDGNARPEPGAVVCRMAPSFLRFGNFEIFASRRDVTTLETLARHTLTHLFPELGAPSPAAYAALFAEVCRRTAVMIAHWMRVGFVHGVMNTDNMSVLGLTIDYGPYGWLDDFNPSWTPNTTDRHGRRYRYAHQPRIALWNLVRFAEALLPLIEDPKPLEAVLGEYETTLRASLREMLLAKVGLEPGSAKADADPDAAEDLPPFGIDTGDALLDDLGHVLQAAETDMTAFFRKLADVPCRREALIATDAELVAPLLDAYYDRERLSPDAMTKVAAWLRRYIARTLEADVPNEVRVGRMRATNPKYVLRNYIAQLAIDGAEQGDFSVVRELLEVLARPYDEQPGKERFAALRPDWARQRPGCSMLSCSS